MTLDNFTPTQQKMLAVLADGKAHAREELHKCLEDPLTSVKAIRAHLSSIRKLLRPAGEDIICELKDRAICYRHVRLLSGPNGEPSKPLQP